MQDARETVRGAKLYFCSQTEIQERYEVTMSQIYLEMNHIKKTFGELEVLKDISLSVHKGEVVSVIAASFLFSEKRLRGKKTENVSMQIRSN